MNIKQNLELKAYEAMVKNGIEMELYEKIILDGNLYRFQPKGTSRGNKSGWYAYKKPLFSFGCWKDDSRYTVKLYNPSATEAFNSESFIKQKRGSDQQLKVTQQQAALDAYSEWEDSSECSSHVYLSNKDVAAYGLRLSRGNLIIPLVNNDNQLKSLHYINPYGKKWFFKGGEIKGNYFGIGHPDNSSVIMISEGYATSATLLETTGIPQVISFNAGNLVPVAKNIKLRFPDASIIIAADNDKSNATNIGVNKGKEASRLVDGKLIIPNFLDGDSGTDFNDFVTLYGKDQLFELLTNEGVLS